MEKLSLTELIAIRSSCEKGYSKEEATKLLTEVENKLEKFKEDNKDILSRLDELESERRKWEIYIQELQYMVGKCYEYKHEDYTAYMRVKSCGSGRYFSGCGAVETDNSSYKKIDEFVIKVWDTDNLKEISQDRFDELWNKAED